MLVKSFLRRLLIAAAVIATAFVATPCLVEAAPVADDPLQVQVPLSGHVIPALSNATLLPDSAKVATFDEDALSLTIVLRRTDEPGFQAYLTDVYDRQSANYKHFLSPQELTSRFGPSEDVFTQVQTFFQQQGFIVTERAANRLTFTVTAPRAQVEKALSVAINDYRVGERQFFANASEPSLPSGVAQNVQAIVGLSNLAQVQRPNFNVYNKNNCGSVDVPIICPATIYAYNVLCFSPAFAQLTWIGNLLVSLINRILNGAFLPDQCKTPLTGPPPPPTSKREARTIEATGGDLAVPNNLDGTGQSIGLVEFDSFVQSDISDYLALRQAPSTVINQLSTVAINGGAPLGPNQAEVVLDIDTVLVMAPMARVVVYSAPTSGGGSSYQAIFNRMITDGMTVISNSWSYCEDQTTLADVQSIDSILATAAASGISVFNGSGDNGSTCLDGSPNTAGVPATSPNATAVGGTSLTIGPGGTYVSETWWDGTSATPPTGQGGFGTSRFFSRPAYQNGLTASASRSVPDVAIVADPANGMTICLASQGGCPNGLSYGGTSYAAPQMAALAALFNQARGSNVGAYNPVIYPYVNTPAFHNAASMGSDFAHVGLGSPNFGLLNEQLNGITPGVPDKDVSNMTVLGNVTWVTPEIYAPQPADGSTPTQVIVQLRDVQGNIVSGKTVSLNAGPGSHAVITPPTAVTNVDNGTVIFNVVDSTIEDIVFTATDVTDGVTLSTTDTAHFVSPPATSASIAASPTAVPPDQTSTTTITVTLKDANNNPSPGKTVTLSQGTGHSVVTAPSPAVTDAAGRIQFVTTDGVSEIVTYTAVDVTDGNLPVPGSAVVDFTGSATSCIGAPAVAATGFALTPFSTGYFAQNFNFGNVNWGGCPGASNPTFSPSNQVYVANFRTGDLFRFGLNGGAISNADKISNQNLTLGQPTFGKDGRLYATHGATTGDFTTGNIVELDPTTGAQIRVVAPNLTCPNSLSVDPLSGDLFFDDQCFGAGSDNPSLWRVHDPGGAATLSVYATLPGSPNGAMSFAPNGSLYIVVSYLDTAPQVYVVSGTNGPATPTITPVTGLMSTYWVTLGQTNPDGSAKSLIILDTPGLELVDITTTPFTRTQLTAGQSIGSGVIGPDGCLYAAQSDRIYKLTSSSGACSFVPTNPGPTLSLIPSSVSPGPAQGSTQTFTATFNNASVGAGVPVTFVVTGANAQTKLGTTNASGVASISYVGTQTGADTITANGIAGSTLLTSNAAQITWVAGKHVSLIALNTSPTSGNPGVASNLVAALADVSVKPNAPIGGVIVQLTLGAQSCAATTNALGIATCGVAPSAGQLTLTATFAGNSQYTASTASQGFSVLAANGSSPPGAPTIGIATAGDGFIVVSFAAPASDGGSPITLYVAICTPAGPGAAVSGAGTSSPITVSGATDGVTYTCAVDAANVAGPGPSSTASNQATPAGSAPPLATSQIPTLHRANEAALAVLLALLAAYALRRRRGRLL